MGKSEHSIDQAAIAAVCFDVTNTLIHCPQPAAIYSEVLGRHGIAVAPDDINRVLPRVWQEVSCQTDPRRDRFSLDPSGEKGWWRRFVERVCRHLDVGEPSRFASAELFHRFGQPGAWEIYPDTVPTLEALSAAGFRLGLVSNWDHRLPTLLRKLELSHFFDAITYSANCGVEKPHPLIFELCLRQLGTTAPHAVHLGDHPLEDIEGATAAGLWTLQVDRTREPESLNLLLEPLLRSTRKTTRWVGRQPTGGQNSQL